MRPVVALAAAVRFALELTALAVLAWWGWAAAGPVLAVLTPLVAAVVWGLFCSPRAKVPLPLPAVLLVQALVLGSAAGALILLGHPAWAAAFVTAAVVSGVVLFRHDRRTGDRTSRPAR